MLLRLQTVFREVLSRPNLILTLDATAEDVPGWDSFAHVNLIVAIEEAFDVTFTTTEIGAIKSVGDIIRALEAKHAAS